MEQRLGRPLDRLERRSPGQPPLVQARASGGERGCDPGGRRAADDVARGQRAIDRGRGSRSASPIPGSSARRGRGRVAAGAEREADHRVGDLVEADARALRLGHERADDVVGGTERDPAPDQGVGDGGRGRVALGRRPRASVPGRRSASRPARPSRRATRRRPRPRRTAARRSPGGRAGTRAAGP